MQSKTEKYQNWAINLQVAAAVEDICSELGGQYSDDRIRYDDALKLPNRFVLDLKDGRRILIVVEG